MQTQFAKYFPDHSQAGLLKSLHQMKVPDSLAHLAASSYQSLAGGLQFSFPAATGMQFAGNLIWVVIIHWFTFWHAA